jgi:hypothetical protein
MSFIPLAVEGVSSASQNQTSQSIIALLAVLYGRMVTVNPAGFSHVNFEKRE